jgi:hypothetical protein
MDNTADCFSRRELLECLSLSDPGVRELMRVAKLSGYNNERMYLEIAVYQTNRVAWLLKILADASQRGYLPL